MKHLKFASFVLTSLLAASQSFATVVSVGSFESALTGSLENEVAPSNVCTFNFSCLKQQYDATSNIALGAATTVSSVINSPFNAFHDGTNITDGFYGNGSAWVSGTANSSLEIDLGLIANIESIIFGRNRIGPCCEDRQAGSFKIETASADHLFSEALALTAVNYSGGQGVKIDFTAGVPEIVNAQYLRITFTNPGTAIDEVEVFGAAVPTPASFTLFGFALLMITVQRRLKRSSVRT